MKIPFWLPLLLLLLWGGWSFKNYYCDKCGCCGGESAAAAVTGPAIPMFTCGESALPGLNYPSFRDSILKTGGQGDTMVITGVQYADEPEAVAIARAEAFRKILGNKMPNDRVRIATRKLETTCAEAAVGGGVRGVDLAWNKLKLSLQESAIIESENDVTLLFPFNSTEKDRDIKVETYLKSLIDKHKSTTARFNIVGHTDNVGSDEANEKLGLGRAQSIAKILTNGGIAADRITTASKGKSEPVASNDTDEGRQQNRRVVVSINPQ
jgi:outer membrane protein OmpA-like peptidoglycan-associated protein